MKKHRSLLLLILLTCAGPCPYLGSETQASFSDHDRETFLQQIKTL